MMGINTWIQWLAWFIEYFLLMAIVCAIYIFIMFFPVAMKNVEVNGVKTDAPYYRPVVGYIDASLMATFTYTYMLAYMAAGFAASACFQKGTETIYDLVRNALQTEPESTSQLGLRRLISLAVCTCLHCEMMNAKIIRTTS